MFSFVVNDKTKIEIFQLQDRQELFSLIDRNRNYLRHWLLWVDKRVSSDDFIDLIPSWAKNYAETGSFDAGIRYEETLVGMIGMHLDWSNKKASLSYFIAEDAQGKGIVSNCVKSLVEYVFSVLSLNKVEIHVASHNQKSRAIPERLGFIEERVSIDGQWLYDHFEDIVVYRLFQDEWKESRVIS